MRILVCGGRNFDNKSLVYDTLNNLNEDNEIELIIHGNAKGADSLAGDWAVENNIPVQIFQAKWEVYGRAAGMIRNNRMLEVGKPDLVVAFPGGVGTAGMIKIAKAASVEIMTIS